MQETWKPCPDFETTHEVSSLGRVRRLVVIQVDAEPSVQPGPPLKLDYSHQNGYARVHLWVAGRCTKKTVHSLVARAFLGDPPGPVGTRRGEWTVDHLDGNKANNRVDNLEWVPSEVNRRRYLDRSAVRRGETHPNAKLTAAQVKALRQLYATGRYTQYALAEQFGISPGHVSEIVCHRVWKHVA